MKLRRMMMLLGILFAVILIGYSISPIEKFTLRTRDRKRIHVPTDNTNTDTNDEDNTQ